jgi:hypothetical protein
MKTSDITIVFQGAFKPYVTRDRESFSRNVRAVKKVLPGAKILVSTWKGAEIPPDLQADEIIFTEDPGSLAPLKLTDDKPNNLNRQLVSTQAGLAAVTTPYAVKMRTDCFLEHAGFLDYYAEQLKRDRGRERLLTCSFFTLDPTIFERMPYHVSDWFHFAPTELLRRYWSVQPMTAEDGRFHEQHAHSITSTFFEKKFRARFAVEQYICIEYAKSLGYACPTFINDISDRVIADFFRFLAKEVMLLDPWQIGLSFPKYNWVGESLFQRINNLMYVDWLRICGQIDPGDAESRHLYKLASQRQQQKMVARSGFRATRPLHAYMFDSSGKGKALRTVAHHVLKKLV